MIEYEIFQPIDIFVFHHQGDNTRPLSFEMNRHPGLLADAIIIKSRSTPCMPKMPIPLIKKHREGRRNFFVERCDQITITPITQN
jgi:hypothetical protein